jgi:hypothetical protein
VLSTLPMPVSPVRIYIQGKARVNKFMSQGEDYNRRIRQEETHTVTIIRLIRYTLLSLRLLFFKVFFL